MIKSWLPLSKLYPKGHQTQVEVVHNSTEVYFSPCYPHLRICFIDVRQREEGRKKHQQLPPIGAQPGSNPQPSGVGVDALTTERPRQGQKFIFL